MIDSIVSLAGRMVPPKADGFLLSRCARDRINGESPHGFCWWTGEGRYLSVWILDAKHFRDRPAAGIAKSYAVGISMISRLR